MALPIVFVNQLICLFHFFINKSLMVSLNLSFYFLTDILMLCIWNLQVFRSILGFQSKFHFFSLCYHSPCFIWHPFLPFDCTVSNIMPYTFNFFPVFFSGLIFTFKSFQRYQSASALKFEIISLLSTLSELISVVLSSHGHILIVLLS